MGIAGSNIVLGNEIRDRITGMRGIAVCCSEVISGTIQICIQQKKGKMDFGDKYPEGYNIDVESLEKTGEGIASTRIEPPTDIEIELGDEVKDLLTGIVGITKQKNTFINGCVYFNIQPPIKDEKATEPPKCINCSYNQLEIVRKNVIKIPNRQQQNTTSTSLPPRRTGGPVNPAPSRD